MCCVRGHGHTVYYAGTRFPVALFLMLVSGDATPFRSITSITKPSSIMGVLPEVPLVPPTLEASLLRVFTRKSHSG